MEKLNRAQKCSFLGPQNLGSGGGPGPRGLPWIRTCLYSELQCIMGNGHMGTLPHE